MENMGVILDLKSAYSGKKVFLTGHTGFKGTWLLKILIDLGATVKGYALAPENEINLYNEIKGDSLCESDIKDLRDREVLLKSLIDFQPDYVFHLAAQPLVRYSYDNPSYTFEVNALGTAFLLDAVKELPKKCTIVLITTDKVYQNLEIDYAYRENDRLGGYDPYSASKACCELVIDSYRNSFFNLNNYSSHQKAIAVGRAGNVIGGGDWSQDRLLPDIAKSLSKNQEIVIRNPNAVRPWQHVIEPLFGYLDLGAKLHLDALRYSQAYNFGPDVQDTFSVKDMVQKAIESWGSGSFEVDAKISNPHEAGLLKLDITKALSELNWQPMFNASDAVELTINWYKRYYLGVSALDLMKNDLEFYQKKLNEKE